MIELNNKYSEEGQVQMLLYNSVIWEKRERGWNKW